MNDDPNDPIEPSVGDETEAAAREIARLTAERDDARRDGYAWWAQLDRLTAERDEAQAEAHDRMESALYDALGEPPEAEREAAHDRILSRCGSAADVEISGAGPSWEGLLARVRALRAERDRLAAERTEATRAHYRDLLIVHRTLDEGSNETDLDYALQGIQRLQIERDGLREDVARLTAERDAYASFAHEIAALVVSDGAIDTLRHLGPGDLDHLAEMVRARVAGDTPARRGPPHDWPTLVNGDCEGDGEPEILCGGCGEEGYACYCGACSPDWGRFVCRYCGSDCGEAGCHDTSDADDVPHG